MAAAGILKTIGTAASVVGAVGKLSKNEDVVSGVAAISTSIGNCSSYIGGLQGKKLDRIQQNIQRQALEAQEKLDDIDQTISSKELYFGKIWSITSKYKSMLEKSIVEAIQIIKKVEEAKPDADLKAAYDSLVEQAGEFISTILIHKDEDELNQELKEKIVNIKKAIAKYNVDIEEHRPYLFQPEFMMTSKHYTQYKSMLKTIERLSAMLQNYEIIALSGKRTKRNYTHTRKHKTKRRISCK